MDKMGKLTSVPSKVSASEKFQSFIDSLVLHRILKSVFEQTIHLILNSQPGSIITICGPSGVGKTKLKTHLEKEILRISELKMEEEPGHIPLVSLDAIAPESGNFNWKDFFKRVLMFMQEPLIKQKRKSTMSREAVSELNALGLRKNAAGAELRLALESCFKNRCPKVFIIDEAQHILITHSTRQLSNQLNTLKSIADCTGVTQVLIGTYDLRVLSNMSAQLNRRMVEVHFPNYKYQVEEDVEGFINVLHTFQKIIPLNKVPDLAENYEYFYEKTAGCVGILKDWLSLAVAHSLNDGKRSLSMDLIAKYEISSSRRFQIVQEIKERERMLDENHDNEIRSMLGMDEEIVECAAPVKVPPKKRRGRVGQRKPTRDPVGM